MYCQRPSALLRRASNARAFVSIDEGHVKHGKEGFIIGKKIAVVDDEVEQIDFASTVLEENGYEVISAADGKEGMRKVKEEKPDLILLDILMPERGGIAMYQDLKQDEETRNIPVIIVTGVPRGGRFEEVMMTQEDTIPPPDGYVEKPMDPDALLKLVADLLS